MKKLFPHFKMLVYTEYDTPRFRYAVKAVLCNYIGEIIFTSSINDYNISNTPKIFYGRVAYLSYIDSLIQSTEKIWLSDIEPISFKIKKWKNNWALDFSNHHSFDIFASTFYLLSRYEEFLPFEGDQHGRFCAKSSVFFDDKIYRIPIVDRWRMEFEKSISKSFPEAQFRNTPFSFEVTIDVDSAFAYLHKGWYRTLGGVVKDFSSFRVANFASRMQVLLRFARDPFNTYAYILKCVKKRNVSLVWFFLLSDFSKEDINVPHTSDALQKQIRRIANEYPVGIHPGYASHESVEILKREIIRLKKIIGKSITKSRQHYLKIKMPETYQRLIASNISDDYTMGFADDVGFRAGTSLPFKWFDLEKNEETSLTIHPFVIMDTTLNKYLELTPAEAIVLTNELCQAVKEVNGNFSILWHNESLSETGRWKGWRAVWETLFAASDAK